MNYCKADSLFSHIAWWSIKLSNYSWVAMSHLHNFLWLLSPVNLCFCPTLYLNTISWFQRQPYFSFSNNLGTFSLPACLLKHELTLKWSLLPREQCTALGAVIDASAASRAGLSQQRESLLVIGLYSYCRHLVALSFNSRWWRILFEKHTYLWICLN